MEHHGFNWLRQPIHQSSAGLSRSLYLARRSLTTWTPGNTGSDNSIICTYATAVVRNPTQAEFALNAINFSCFTITVNNSTHVTLNHSYYGNLGNPFAPSYVLFAPSTTLFSDWRGSFHITNVVDDGTGKIKVTIANPKAMRSAPLILFA